ncbi:MAG: hypothetical protein QMD03_03155 [Syntrophales bacterium]|nr:hypothetical protein [Syntrophales bacterium]
MARQLPIRDNGEGVYEDITFVIEAGMIGGVPGFGLNFNTAINAAGIIGQPSMMDFLDGGGHDISCVGFAQIDRQGNVNASKLGGRITRIGGFLKDRRWESKDH